MAAHRTLDNSQHNSLAPASGRDTRRSASIGDEGASPTVSHTDPLFAAPGANGDTKRPSHVAPVDTGSPFIADSIAQLNSGFRSLGLQESLADEKAKFSLDPPRAPTLGGSAPASLQNRNDSDDDILLTHTMSPHLVPSLLNEINRDSDLARRSQTHPALMHPRHSAPDASLPAVSLSTSPLTADSMSAHTTAQTQAQRSSSTLTASIAELRSRDPEPAQHQRQHHRMAGLEDHRRSISNATNGVAPDTVIKSLPLTSAAMTPPAPHSSFGDPLARPELQNRSVSAPYGDDTLLPPNVEDGPTHALFGSGGFAGFMQPLDVGESREKFRNKGAGHRHSGSTVGLPVRTVSIMRYMK